jgi:hypothetical protein
MADKSKPFTINAEIIGISLTLFHPYFPLYCGIDEYSV